jgi:hypothetical protein
VYGGGGPGAQGLTSCVAGPGGFLAAGHDSATGDEDAVLWTSPDGILWTRLDGPEVGGEGTQSIADLVALPDRSGYLAVGAASDRGVADVAVWLVSVDPATHRHKVTRVPLGGAFADPMNRSANAVAVVGDTVVLAGADRGQAGFWESDELLARLPSLRRAS